MMRQPNTTITGRSFDEATISQVWDKGGIISGLDPAVFRTDCCGVLIARSRHGQTSEYGWEIDHIKPVVKGGSDSLSNLEPLYWVNNRHKSDHYPDWMCAVRA
jgi:hypothetical protein